MRVLTFARSALVELEHGRVHAPERELACCDTRLELGEHRLRVRAGKRPGLWNAHVLRRSARNSLGRDERTVDGKHEADVVRRRSKPGDDAEDRGALLEPSSRTGNGSSSSSASLPDRNHLVAHLAENSPRPLGERLAAKVRDCLRRAEALGRSADEQNPRPRWPFGPRPGV